jgi:anti-anti-sigma factor
MLGWFADCQRPLDRLPVASKDSAPSRPGRVRRIGVMPSKGFLLMQMRIEEVGGGVTGVILRGRLDTAGVDGIDLLFKAIAESKRAIVVDLSQADFLASLGIRMLMSGARAVRNQGGKLVLLSPNENVRSVLQTVGIEDFIPVVFDHPAAVAAVLTNR